ncbi:hypothetical protein [Peptostreptococcus stomatis]
MFDIERHCKFCGEKLDLSLKNHYVAEKLEKKWIICRCKNI